jgi:DNA-binding transcriptional ArsR family regulator
VTEPSHSDYIDDELAKAIAHPTRAQILAEANERVMSPAQFARRHDMDVSNVAYHFKELAERYNCLELVGERPNRGSTEHFYKATRRTLFDGKSWDNLPETIKNKISGETITHLLDAIAEAMLDETFDERNDRALTWDKVLLDEAGWDEIAGIFRDCTYKILIAAEKARERLDMVGGEGILASWALLFFKSPFKEPEHDLPPEDVG